MEHISAPTVSVIMPAYNSRRFIAQAIASVQAQTVTDWELLVIDDGSQDDTCAIVEALAAQDQRIHLVRNQQNMGVAATRNRGFDLCRGQFVALLDSDDLWYPHKLQRQLELLDQTGADIAYCSYAIVDEEGRSLCRDFIVPERTDYSASLVQSVISCSTSLFRWESIKHYRFGIGFYHEDLVLWLQMLRDGLGTAGASEVLAAYRIVEGSRASNKVKSAVNRWRVYRGLKISPAKSTLLLFRYALLALRKYNSFTGQFKG